MSTDFEHGGLKWVVDEIYETLKQARVHFESFVEDAEDSTQLQFCTTYLHQVSGSLNMLELGGASLLAEEMELLAQKIYDEPNIRNEETYELLMRSLIQLPDYLERLERGARDLPMVLLPLLNDIRATRGETLLTEGAVFSVDLSLDHVVPEKDNGINPGLLAKKIRQYYHVGLLGWYRDTNNIVSINKIKKVIYKLKETVKTPSYYQLFSLMDAFIDGLMDKGIESSASTKFLLGQADHYIKLLIDVGESTDNFTSSDEKSLQNLKKNLLFYIANSKTSSVAIDAIFSAYKLSELLPDEAELEDAKASMGGANADLMSAVTDVILTDLSAVKEQLDVFVRNIHEPDGSLSAENATLLEGSEHRENLQNIVVTMTQISDTLAMLGKNTPRNVLQEKIELLKLMLTDGFEPDRKTLMEVASALLFVESSVSEMGHGHLFSNSEEEVDLSKIEMTSQEKDELLKVAIKESKIELISIKESIVFLIDAFANGTQTTEKNDQTILSIITGLQSICGVLDILGNENGSNIVRDCATFVQEKMIIGNEIVEEDKQHSLADTITALEYYLDAVARKQKDLSVIESVAQAGIDQLFDRVNNDSEFESELSKTLSLWMKDVANVQVKDSLLAEVESIIAQVKLLQNEHAEEIAQQMNSMISLVGNDQSSLSDDISSTLRWATETLNRIISKATQQETLEVADTNTLENEKKSIELAENSTTSSPPPSPLLDLEQDLPPKQTDIDNAFVEEAPVIEAGLDVTDIQLEEAPFAETTEQNNSPEIEIIEPLLDAEPLVDELEPLADRLEPLADELEPSADKLEPSEDELELLPEKEVQEVFVRVDEPAKDYPDIKKVGLSDDIDEEIIEIFIEEAQEEIEKISELFPKWKNSSDSDVLTEMRRSYHTLKGSGRLVGAYELGEFSWAFENMMNRIIDNTITSNELHFAIVEKSIEVLPEMVDAFEKQRLSNVDSSRFAAYADLLSQGEAFDVRYITEDIPETSDVSQAEIQELDVSSDSDKQNTSTHNEAIADTNKLSEDDEEIDLVLLEIFSNEASTHIKNIEQFILSCHQDDDICKPNDILIRSLHTLRGSAHMAEIHAIGNTSEHMEKAIKCIAEKGQNIDLELINLLDEMCQHSLVALKQLDETATIPEENRDLENKIINKLDEILQLDNLLDFTEVDESISISEERLEQEAIEEQEQKFNLSDKFLEPTSEEALTLTAVDRVDDGDTVEIDSDVAEAEEDLPLDLGGSFGTESTEDVLILDELVEPEEALTLDLDETSELDSNDEALAFDETVEPEDVLTLDLGEGSESDSNDEVLAFDETVESKDDLTLDFGDTPVTEVGEEISALEGSEDDLVLDLNEPSVFTSDDPSSTADVELAKDSHLSLSEDEDLANEYDDELLEIFVEEAEELLVSSEQVLNQLKDDNTDTQALNRLLRDMHTLKGGARMAGVSAIGDLAHSFETKLEHYKEGDALFSPAQIDRLLQVQDTLASMVENLKKGQVVESNPEFISYLENLNDLEEQEIPPATNDTEVKKTDSEELENNADLPSGDLNVDTFGETEAVQEQDNGLESEEDDDYDDELLEIFLEEAQELMDSSEATLTQLKNDPGNKEQLNQLLRDLHTIKGGARMAGITPIGDLAHSLETQLESITEQNKSLDVDFFEVLYQSHDTLSEMLENLKSGNAIQSANDDASQVIEKNTDTHETEDDHHVKGDDEVLQLEEYPSEEHGSDDEEKVPQEQELEDSETLLLSEIDDAHNDSQTSNDVIKSSEVIKESSSLDVPEQVSRSAEIIQPEAVEPEKPTVHQATKSSSNERVRVSADILDELVNYAGEVSIYRSRLDQGSNEFQTSLDEMNATIVRMREQLRRFEMETEAQIQSRRDQAESLGYERYEEFDPLEFDRFSNMQQITRAMAESVADLDSIENTMTNLNSESETLLIQQGRVNTDLQEGLMRTRMIPFKSQLARFRRIIRQTSNELNKQINFELFGGDQEIDRRVLEKIMAPLEHMLRNSVAHGIESPEQRKQAGKNPKGNIKLFIGRDGSEIDIKVIDDGAGINIDAVRKKAIQQGLMAEGANLSDRDIMQFILESGFSTASEVSQISGRGVGMDVVGTEIKQLNGTLSIDSVTGKGSTFKILMPLTMSVSRALMVEVGEEIFAIPLVGIENIIRETSDVLKRLTAHNDTYYQWHDEEYQFLHLGSVLGIGQMTFPDEKMKAPILLARSGENRIAISVDGLLGSREIVVKSVGPQLSTVKGVTGATILGDGKISLILDLAVLAREGVAMRQTSEQEDTIQVQEERQITVMVVDDSITVRKVTQRLLKRYEYEVITAKDGVDAIATLHETIPDVMLLDVEMPRMDGFELATHMRDDEKFKNVPIIMITSRTGDKHRDRAMKIGVNEYMGKPYQEHDLISNIKKLTTT